MSKLSSLLSNSYAVLISRLVLGGVFLVSGVIKVADTGAFAAAIRSYELGLPEWFVSFSAIALPFAEVMLGLYLVAGLFAKPSAWVTNLLMLVFIVALAQGAARGLEINCGCFGGSQADSNLWLAVLRDFGLLALGLHIALAPMSHFSVDSLLRRRAGGSYGALRA